VNGDRIVTGPNASPWDLGELRVSASMALRAACRSFGVPGPADRTRSQALRAVVAADFCKGISAALDLR